MGLQIICAGWSRTGTFSLKAALEQLGIGRCYHMHEVFAHPEHMSIWERAARGGEVDWDEVFDGYVAAADAPACMFWRALSEYYPAAKVILTVRDPREWYESMRSTVVEVMRTPARFGDRRMQDVLEAANRLVLDGFFGGRFDDADDAIDRFRAHCEQVQREIRPDRLLTYEVSQGWEPLCTFLGLPVPSEPFPITNQRDSFRSRSKLSHEGSV